LNLAELEGEILLLGIWKNVADLEESLSLPELELILEAYRKQKHEDRKFMAALKGIDLDEGKKEEAQDFLANIERRAKARIGGVDEATVDRITDADIFGLEFEVEE
jgi:hypothetical protein